mmetsp:Transcript_41822/g.69655  ORF Transcript_41822/g.69655 Transcript_41822/m.69655 type:complete len:103 (-) Transcript_41822:760-1068(-)
MLKCLKEDKRGSRSVANFIEQASPSLPQRQFHLSLPERGPSKDARWERTSLVSGSEAMTSAVSRNDTRGEGHNDSDVTCLKWEMTSRTKALGVNFFVEKRKS